MGRPFGLVAFGAYVARTEIHIALINTEHIYGPVGVVWSVVGIEGRKTAIRRTAVKGPVNISRNLAFHDTVVDLRFEAHGREKATVVGKLSRHVQNSCACFCSTD